MRSTKTDCATITVCSVTSGFGSVRPSATALVYLYEPTLAHQCTSVDTVSVSEQNLCDNMNTDLLEMATVKVPSISAGTY